MAPRSHARAIGWVAAALALAPRGPGARAADDVLVPTEPARCDTTAPAKALGLARREWHVACREMGGGRRIVAAVPLTPLKAHKKPSAPPLAIWVALGHGDEILWRDKLDLGTTPTEELRDVLTKSEEWLVDVDPQALGSGHGVRVGVVGHWGTDQMSVREIALLFRLVGDKGPLELVWSGLGNTRESRFDYCHIDGVASFQLVDDQTIERQMRVTPTINREVTLPRKKARALEKACVSPPAQPQRFPTLR